MDPFRAAILRDWIISEKAVIHRCYISGLHCGLRTTADKRLIPSFVRNPQCCYIPFLINAELP